MSSFDWLPIQKNKAGKAKALMRINSEAKYISSNRKLYDVHQNQIDDAIGIVRQLIIAEKIPTIQISVSMQAGKTGVAKVVFLLLKKLIPNLKGYYVCANDQISHRTQIKSAIEGINDFEYLSLSDRRKWIDNDTPSLIIFDENHFGDGKYQTMQDFLIKNNLFIKQKGEWITNPLFNDTLLCLSATGFSALNYVDYVFIKDINKLHKTGYNSTSLLLQKNKIEDCDSFIKKGKVLWESNVLKYLDSCVRKYKGCYGIIRCNAKGAALLRKELTAKYGSKIYIRDWNQHNPLNHLDYFNGKKPTFTVVLLQNMCRMGASLNTEHIRFMAEHLSPMTYLATSIQGFIGRCCGYGKTNHNIKIFSQKSHAQAYSYWENDKKEAFMNFCTANNIKLSDRSKIERQPNPKNVKITFCKYSSELSDKAIKEKVKQKFNRNFVIRSTTATDPTRAGKKGMHKIANVDDLIGLNAAIGSMAGLIYDSTGTTMKTVKVVERLASLPDEKKITAKPNCIFDIT